MIAFKIKSVTIKIQFLFVAVVCVFLLTDTSGVGILAFLACIVHELAHVVMFALVGCAPKELSFEITGMKLVKRDEILPYRRDLLIQFAGSFTNFLIFFIILNVGLTTDKMSIFAVSHLLIGTFNLLPLKSFDGGKILNILLCRFINEERANNICNVTNKIMLIILCMTSLISFIFISNSFTLCILTIYLLISCFIKE